jgi:hypothetical protein
VGAGSFLAAFKFLEQRGKLRHARFRVNEDKGEFERWHECCRCRRWSLNGVVSLFSAVPQVPLFRYRHVGMEILLYNELPHRIDYPTVKHWSQKGEGFLNGLTSLPGALQHHKYVTKSKRHVKLVIIRSLFWCLYSFRNEEVLRRIKKAKKAKGFLNIATLGTEYRTLWGLQPALNFTGLEMHEIWLVQKFQFLTRGGL